MSCALDLVARSDVSQHGPEMGLNGLKAEDRHQMQGRRLRPRMCTQVMLPLCPKAVEEGHADTFRVGGHKQRRTYAGPH